MRGSTCLRYVTSNFDHLSGGILMGNEWVQVFVANPNKSVAVQRILINNRDRLLKFLPRFLEDRTDDDQFTDEKSFLVRQIELLPKEPIDPTRSAREPSRPGVNTATVA